MRRHPRRLPTPGSPGAGPDRAAGVVLVDSSVLIGWLRKDASVPVQSFRRLLEADADLAVGDLIVMEVLQGCATLRSLHAARTALSGLQQVELAGLRACEAAAERYRHLRQAGVTPRSSIDMLIASWCVDHDAWLLHRDRDFDAMAPVLGLKFIDPN